MGENTRPTQMWCPQCQQDVPVSRLPSGAGVCPRCTGTLRQAASDAGVELTAYDRPPAAVGLPPTLSIDSTAAELERLARKLRPAPLAGSAATLIDASGEMPAIRPSAPRVDDEPPLWGPTLVLLAGLAALAGAGAAVAAHAAGHATVEVWRWGLVAALCGEGLLVSSLAWIASRLWRYNRRLTRRVEHVERLLAEQAEQRAPTTQSRSPKLRVA